PLSDDGQRLAAFTVVAFAANWPGNCQGHSVARVLVDAATACPLVWLSLAPVPLPLPAEGGESRQWRLALRLNEPAAYAGSILNSCSILAHNFSLDGPHPLCSIIPRMPLSLIPRQPSASITAFGCSAKVPRRQSLAF